MANGNHNELVSIVHPLCCGLDVHKEMVSACLITNGPLGAESEIKEFSTFTDDLIKLRDWLIKADCPIVAMESTGIYWRPVHNILEGYMEVMLVNARHIKNVPGRKTDIEDSKWLAGLLRCGLVRGSFIPPKQVREWRDLTRLRRTHVESAADYKRRTHKLFESANIKIDSVVSDLFGETGRNLMELLIDKGSEGSSAEVARCARGKLKKKVTELHRAIQGYFTDHHRYILASLLKTIGTLEEEIEAISVRLRSVMIEHQGLVGRLMGIAGISEVTARAILAEIGPTLETFKSSAALASWSGLCPGNNESAGKRFSGKSPVRKNHLKTILIESAWAAVKVKGSYYRDKYHRLKTRRGAKKAIVGIAHRLLKAIYHVTKHGVAFKDLGEDFLTRKNAARKLENLRKHANQLGYGLVPKVA
ncbi:MAG: IS110 family transposase [Syntrophobacteraceae bacterium]|nr:IS110 family transposase [Syntrophobacteraceae bacterium]